MIWSITPEENSICELENGILRALRNEVVLPGRSPEQRVFLLRQVWQL